MTTPLHWRPASLMDQSGYVAQDPDNDCSYRVLWDLNLQPHPDDRTRASARVMLERATGPFFAWRHVRTWRRESVLEASLLAYQVREHFERYLVESVL